MWSLGFLCLSVGCKELTLLKGTRWLQVQPGGVSDNSHFKWVQHEVPLCPRLAVTHHAETNPASVSTVNGLLIRKFKVSVSKCLIKVQEDILPLIQKASSVGTDWWSPGHLSSCRVFHTFYEFIVSQRYTRKEPRSDPSSAASTRLPTTVPNI